MDIETATAKPLSPVAVSVTARHHTIVQDKPPTNGGEDRGMMASEYLLASLLACQHSTFVKVAAKRRVAASVRRLDGALVFDSAGDIQKVEIRFEVAAPDATDEAISTILKLTDKTCTISKALRVPIKTTMSRVHA